jgi:hypothetical protein
MPTVATTKEPSRGVLRLIATVALLLAFDALVNFLPVDRDALWRVDTDADMISFDTENRDSDFFPNHHCFAYAAGQDKHFIFPRVARESVFNFEYPLTSELVKRLADEYHFPMTEPLDDSTKYDPISLLRGYLARCNQATLADEIGVSPQYLSEILRSKKPPSDKVLDFLKLERIVIYRLKPDSDAKRSRARRR